MNWFKRLLHTHDFKLNRIDFDGPFRLPDIKEVHVSICNCGKYLFEEYNKKGERISKTEL